MFYNVTGRKRLHYAIQGSLSNIHVQFGHSTQKWIGLFTPLDVLIGVRAREENFMTFDVHDNGRLTFTYIN